MPCGAGEPCIPDLSLKGVFVNTFCFMSIATHGHVIERRFAALVRSFCEAVGIEDVEKATTGSPISLAGARHQIFLVGAETGRFAIKTFIGNPKPEHRQQVYRGALRHNLLAHMRQAPVLTASSVDGSLWLLRTFALDGCGDGNALRSAVSALAVQAKSLRLRLPVVPAWPGAQGNLARPLSPFTYLARP